MRRRRGGGTAGGGGSSTGSGTSTSGAGSTSGVDQTTTATSTTTGATTSTETTAATGTGSGTGTGSSTGTGGTAACEQITDENTCFMTVGCTWIGGASQGGCVPTTDACTGVMFMMQCNFISGCHWDADTMTCVPA